MPRRQATKEVVVELHAMQPGGAFSGIVVARDAERGFAPGEEVFGVASPDEGARTFVACRRGLVRKPVSLAHPEAALLAEHGPVALRALRLAGARAGERVLINDASGAVGALLVQIARVWGWRVTALCPERHVPRVWELGADDVRARERVHDHVGRHVALVDTEGSIGLDMAAQLLEHTGRLLRVRRGAVKLSTTSGLPVIVQPPRPASEAELVELVELVARSGVYPVHPETADK